MAALFVTVSLLLLAVCSVLFVLVERPFMNLRRRSLSETPVPAAPAAPAGGRPLGALAPEPSP
jgi:peptidoglycan/LPS O-acetylase OafA/YrhL